MDNNTRMPYAAVYLHYWNGSRWVNIGQRATTNPYGSYSISGVQVGRYYRVMGWKAYESCYTGRANYRGDSRNLDLRHPSSNSVTANVPMYFEGWAYC